MASLDFENSVGLQVQFQMKLTEIYAEGKKTVLIKKANYFKLIEDLEVANEASSKIKRQFYIICWLVTQI